SSAPPHGVGPAGVLLDPRNRAAEPPGLEFEARAPSTSSRQWLPLDPRYDPHVQRRGPWSARLRVALTALIAPQHRGVPLRRIDSETARVGSPICYILVHIY